MQRHKEEVIFVSAIKNQVFLMHHFVLEEELS